jgi:hypothetical protein
MPRLLRILLIATALLSGGALQVAAAMGADACCAEEAGGGGEETPCPPGLACACCPIRGAVQFAAADVAPAPSRRVAVAVAAAEPTLGGSVTDIFHPPRA